MMPQYHIYTNWPTVVSTGAPRISYLVGSGTADESIVAGGVRMLIPTQGQRHAGASAAKR